MLIFIYLPVAFARGKLRRCSPSHHHRRRHHILLLRRLCENRARSAVPNSPDNRWISCCARVPTIIIHARGSRRRRRRRHVIAVVFSVVFVIFFRCGFFFPRFSILPSVVVPDSPPDVRARAPRKQTENYTLWEPAPWRGRYIRVIRIRVGGSCRSGRPMRIRSINRVPIPM